MKITLFTSGSTGKQKSVTHDMRDFYKAGHWLVEKWGIDERDVIINPFPSWTIACWAFCMTFFEGNLNRLYRGNEGGLEMRNLCPTNMEQAGISTECWWRGCNFLPNARAGLISPCPLEIFRSLNSQSSPHQSQMILSKNPVQNSPQKSRFKFSVRGD